MKNLRFYSGVEAFYAPPPSNEILKKELGGTRASGVVRDKTTHSDKSIPKHMVKRTFGKIAQTGAVRNGELIKG